ncbi:MAG: NTP transferase domain-containing protein [Actinomycetota bacterium]
MRTVAVLAGGLGSRMTAGPGRTMPKVLLPVAGRPFLDFKLASLAAEGVERVVLLLGHRAEQVVAHLAHRSGAAGLGLDITVLRDGPQLLGTGGAVRRALRELGDPFWVTYGDTYLRVPMATVEERFGDGSWDGVMTVLENRDAWDRSNVRVEDGRVTAYRKGAPAGTFRHIDYGLLLFDAAAFAPWGDGERFDLTDVVVRLVDRGRLGAFQVSARFYEVGRPEAYVETDRFLAEAREWERLTAALAGRAGEQ